MFLESQGKVLTSAVSEIWNQSKWMKQVLNIAFQENFLEVEMWNYVERGTPAPDNLSPNRYHSDTL